MRRLTDVPRNRRAGVGGGLVRNAHVHRTLLKESDILHLSDACKLLRRDDLDRIMLRLAFVVYGVANRRDWRTVSPDDVKVDPVELQSQLLPTLRTTTEESPTNVAAWGEQLVSECRDLFEKVLPLTAEEQEFIARRPSRGTIAPERLTSDPVMQATIREHLTDRSSGFLVIQSAQ
ncbi:MAG: hypothetical protein KatS3mg082_0544 [Nitrospiraceae bacterium]|nr:MAG: hypothetical protein KatS3mg082_0544 [Nitrospiraceae bacterium]